MLFNQSFILSFATVGILTLGEEVSAFEFLSSLRGCSNCKPLASKKSGSDSQISDIDAKLRSYTGTLDSKDKTAIDRLLSEKNDGNNHILNKGQLDLKFDGHTGSDTNAPSAQSDIARFLQQRFGALQLHDHDHGIAMPETHEFQIGNLNDNNHYSDSEAKVRFQQKNKPRLQKHQPNQANPNNRASTMISFKQKSKAADRVGQRRQ